MKSKTRDEVVTFIQAVANHQGFRINTDMEFIGVIIDGLNTNYNRYGYFLCPCRESQEDRGRDADIICPCKYARADLTEHGHCYCGLFITRDFLLSRAEVQAIPERRPEEKSS